MKKSVFVLAASVIIALLAASCASSAPAAAAAAAPAAEPAKASGPVLSASAELALMPDMADLKDGGGEGIRVEGAGNIGWWSSTKDVITWAFQVADAGDYNVSVNYSVDVSFANAKVKVAAGDKSIEWLVASTETWSNFQKIDLGTLALAAGPQTLTMQATAIKDRFVANIKSVTLSAKK